MHIKDVLTISLARFAGILKTRSFVVPAFHAAASDPSALRWAKDAEPVRPTVSFDASVDEQAAARAAALRAKKKQERRRRRRRRRDRAAAAASDDDEATSFCPWWLRCDCTAADVVDDAGDVEGGGVEARDVDASVSARDVEPDACRVC